MRPKLLVVELWGLGDLVIATPFLRAAAERFDVTLLAKSYARDLQLRLWPRVNVVALNAPWTAFEGKYHFWRWPIPEMVRLWQGLAEEHFDFGLSARRDPRDHWVLKIVNAKERIGFPWMGSQILLTRSLERPEPDSHRYESWRAAGRALGMELPPREVLAPPAHSGEKTVLIHSGARLPARIWPLENWLALARHLREKDCAVQVACDPDQEDWWKRNGEGGVACSRTVAELFALIERAGVLIGNCSGPGHLAAISGVPTFTIFGPSLPEWFAPLHPQSEGIIGKACPYRPCWDYCRFPRPFCIQDLPEKEVFPHVETFVRKILAPGSRKFEYSPFSFQT